MSGQGDRRVTASDRVGRERGRPVRIVFEGRELPVFSGETVSVALYAWGTDILSRSMKFHRPRGLFCARGDCGRCLMRIDGVPNRNGCRVHCADGMTVLREPGFPSADHDWLAASDRMFRDKMDYHSLLTGSALSTRFVTRFVRGVSGLGALPDGPAEPARPIDERRVGVLVIGAGPAGVAAALAAADAGAHVLIVDRENGPGGHILDRTNDIGGASPSKYTEDLAEALAGSGVDAAWRTEAVGHYEEGFFVLRDEAGLTRVRADRVVVATGSYDQSALFAGNDRPGVFSARGASRLVARWGVKPGRKVALAGWGPWAAAAASACAAVGAEVVAVATTREDVEGDIPGEGANVFRRHRLVEARGSKRVSSVTFESLTRPGSLARVVCDTLILDEPAAPSYELAAQAGATVGYDTAARGFVCGHDEDGRTSRTEIFVAGETAGVSGDVSMIKESGERAGRVAGTEAARGRASGG